jgi:hypothetical protein
MLTVWVAIMLMLSDGVEGARREIVHITMYRRRDDAKDTMSHSGKRRHCRCFGYTSGEFLGCSTGRFGLFFRLL